MNWTDWACLLVGIGVGVTIERWSRAVGNSKLGAGVLPPITSESALTEKLSQMELAYHRATEMSQFKGGFLTRTSHELRSPLNGLIGMQQLILTDLCDSPEEEREFIAQSNEAALKMVAVLDSIIEVARLEQGRSSLEIQPVQLSQLLQDVHTMTHLQARNRNLHFEVSYPAPDLYVLADPFQLRQVLINLVDRAVQQMQFGRLAVSVYSSPESAQIRLDTSEPDCWSEPIDFLQTPAPFPSTGLTFWIDQILLQQMRGELELVAIDISSELGEPKGLQTRLQCTVPLVPTEELES